VQALNGDYPASSTSAVAMPPVSVGQYSDVRLQYRRWLASEDNHFDQARITANGNPVWVNATSNMGDSSQLQHIDKEWRFHDVPLSGSFSGHTVTVGWDLTSDAGLQFGGWALDDVCIVANPLSICGDGVQTITEQCDDGPANADRPDSCRTDCTKPRCGDGIVDTGEDCDTGSAGGNGCSPTCKLVAIADGGCCSTTGDPAAPLALSALAGALVLRRRRP
jgi:MYXO-CTERM domain-containing protein